jgi:anaerobic magnesium-protoporphyrin IX monomethyl ester cyclase
MIRVLLINPPQTRYKGSISFDLQLPIGIMYVAARVSDICQVEIFDCVAFDFERRTKRAITYGASPEEIRKIIEEKKPDIVGISVHATPNYREAELVARIAKEVNPKIVTVLGGPDPSVRFETILKNQYCDYCIVGEGEETFYEFVANFPFLPSLEKIKGLAYKRNNIVNFVPRQFNSNLDSLPFPAFDLVDMNRYLTNKKYYRIRSEIWANSATVITSRGCPNHCVFCSIRLHMGQKFRVHSPEYVLKLLRFCKEKYGISNFHFEDDNMTLDQERFERILDLIIKENLQIKWDTPNGVRVDSLNFSLLKKMKQSGCVHLALAIESGNQRVLDQVIHKGLNLKLAVEIVKYCKELKIPAHSFYVIGFPGETICEMTDTVNLAIELYRKYDLSPYLMVATPLYGTALYETCVKNKFIKGEPTCEELGVAIQSWGEPMISTPDFSQEDIKRVLDNYYKKLRKVFIRHSLKHPRKLLGHLRQRRMMICSENSRKIRHLKAADFVGISVIC